MFETIVILIWFPIILVTSYFIKKILLTHDIGPFKSLINTLRYIGVAVHEISHFIMCLIVGIRPTGIEIKLKDEMTRETAPHGAVFFGSRSYTFLQHALIGLAPTIVSTWLFFWSLEIVFTQRFDPLIRISAGFFCLTLLLGAAPSVPDFSNIGRSFKQSPKYSCYQIFLVVLSGFMVWCILLYYEIIIYDLLYFILVGIGYTVLKYSFKGIKIFLYTIYSKDRRSSSGRNFKKFTQKRFKPSKPYKLGKEEAHW